MIVIYNLWLFIYQEIYEWERELLLMWDRKEDGFLFLPFYTSGFVLGETRPRKAHINHLDQVLSSMFLLVNLITGSVFLQTLTHIQIFAHIFIHSKIFLLLFFFMFFLFPIQLQIFVPSNSALKPFWGSSTYHTDKFLFVCLFTFFLYINNNIKK